MTGLQKCLTFAACLCGAYAMVGGVMAGDNFPLFMLLTACLVSAGGVRLASRIVALWPLMLLPIIDFLISAITVFAVWFALQQGMSGPAWALAIAAWLHGWLAVEKTVSARNYSTNTGIKTGASWMMSLGIPLFFGFWLLFFWQILTVGLEIPSVLLPPPSMVAVRFVTSMAILMADFQQTFLKSVLVGYAIGCSSGILVAVLVDRNDFLRRGLLPIGNFIAALPIIGVAPIMVMWFGFDWQSKAAVVVIMTFFPMLVNTLSGLNVASSMERDLLRTYAASYWQNLLTLRFPAAMPFIFNALKINSTLAIIGAIVAEFFGTPIVGIGFRISTEVGRMNLDMVWAEIVVAALAGSASYGALSLIERRVTFWHPSYRTK